MSAPSSNSSSNLINTPLCISSAKNAEELHPSNFEDSNICIRALDLITMILNKSEIVTFLNLLTPEQHTSLLIEIGENCNFWAYGLDAPTFMTKWLVSDLGCNITFNGHTAMMRRVLEWFDGPSIEANWWIQYMYDNGFTCSVLSMKQVSKLLKFIDGEVTNNDTEINKTWNTLIIRLNTELNVRKEELVANKMQEDSSKIKALFRAPILYVKTSMDIFVDKYCLIENSFINKDEQVMNLLSELKISEFPELMRQLLNKNKFI